MVGRRGYDSGMILSKALHFAVAGTGAVVIALGGVEASAGTGAASSGFAPDETSTSEALDLDALDRVRSQPRLDLTLGIWFPRLEGLVTLGSGGTELDAGPDLSIDDSTAIFNGELEFEKGRWKVLFGGYVIDAGGNGNLQQASVVDGTTLASGTAVNSQVDVWSITTEASWALFTPFDRRTTPWSDPKTDFDPDPVIDFALQGVVGVRVLNLEQRYDFVGYGVVGSNRAWVSPYLGVGLEVDWSTRRSLHFLDRIVFDVTSGWGPALSGGNSTFVVRADVTIYPIRNLGVTLGYRLNDFDLARDDDAFNGGLQGLYAGIGYAW